VNYSANSAFFRFYSEGTSREGNGMLLSGLKTLRVRPKRILHSLYHVAYVRV